MANAWFETVAEAQRRAKKRLPKGVYGALVAGSERGLSAEDNTTAFAELGFAPHVAGLSNERDMAVTVMGQHMSMPVMISPTGVQAVHPDGEVAVARAAAARGVVMGLSSFASKPIEEVVEANPQTFFQMYWVGTREEMLARMERARRAGAVGMIATLDWSFSYGRDWAARSSRRRSTSRPPGSTRRRCWPAPGGCSTSPGPGRSPISPSRTWSRTPAIRRRPSSAPTACGCSRRCRPGGRRLAPRAVGGEFMLKGVMRVDDAKRAVDAGVTAISVSNHGGNNLDGTPARSEHCRPSPRPWATRSRCSWTAASGAAATSRRPSPSARRRSCSAAPTSGASRPTARPAWRTCST